jgi:hypothetical protein
MAGILVTIVEYTEKLLFAIAFTDLAVGVFGKVRKVKRSRGRDVFCLT